MLNQWWIDAGRILASENPRDKELDALRTQGFEIVISLLDEQQQQPRYTVLNAENAGWKRHVLPIPESKAPSLDQLERFATIVKAVPPLTKILVHCSTGRGRAATIGAAYWIMRGSSAAEAIKRIEEVGHRDWKTPAREAVLHEFAWRHNSELSPG